VFPPITDFGLQTARWTPWAAPSRVISATGGWPQHAIDAAAFLRG
jgi:hypothetical protein